MATLVNTFAGEYWKVAALIVLLIFFGGLFVAALMGDPFD